MSAKLDRLIRDLKNAIRGANKKTTSSLDTPATVTRIEGDTVWVHMDGGVAETPVKRTIDAKIGDIVQVRSKGGQAWLTGNQTAPPTDDTKAVMAETKAEKADIIAKLAQKTADKAGKTATNYLSWSAEYGLIISEDATEDPEEMEGGSTRVTYDGVEMYKGRTRVAKFGEETYIGDEDESHVYMDRLSWRMVDKDGYKYAHISDLRDNEDGTTGFLQNFVGDGSTSQFKLVLSPVEIKKIMVDGTTLSPSTYSIQGKYAVLTTAPSAGAAINIQYTSDSAEAKGYTFGIRGSGTIGVMSFAEGYGVVASGFHSRAMGYGSKSYGNFSNANGYGCEASGSYSVAEGAVTQANGMGSKAQNLGTKASSKAQTAIGSFNIEDLNDKYLFIIGNGDENTPSNAFAVDWDGNVECNNVPTMMECGQITVSNVASHSYADYQVTFTKTFSSAPIVVVGMQSASTGYGTGSVSVSAHSITATGFTARIFNNDSSARSPYIHWIAMLQ